MSFENVIKRLETIKGRLNERVEDITSENYSKFREEDVVSLKNKIQKEMNEIDEAIKVLEKQK